MKLGFILFVWFFSALGFAKPTFSEKAWIRIVPIYKEILKHPFNKELANGTLPKEKYVYYQRQDQLYLKTYTQVLSILASRLDKSEEIRAVLKMAMGTVEELEGEKKKVGEATEKLAPANLLYTGFLITLAHSHSREELLAGLLPCFWIYAQVAHDMGQSVTDKNPYREWFQTYSSDSSLKVMQSLTDALAERSPDKEGKMLEAFETASRMELRFWDMAYKMENWN